MPSPKALALEYGVYGAREPPTFLKASIQPPEPEWLDEKVAAAVSKITAYSGLSLKRAGFGDRQARLLRQLLSDPAQNCPRYIYLDHNHLTDVGVEELIALLKEHPDLTEIELYHKEDGLASGAPQVSAGMAARLDAAVRANDAAAQARREKENAEYAARVVREMAAEPEWRWAAVTDLKNIYFFNRRTAGAHPAVPELKQRLKALGQSVSGKAADLVERLRSALARRGMPNHTS